MTADGRESARNRRANAAHRLSFCLCLAALLAGCVTPRVEDVMGQASLAAPPQDFLATANKAAPDPEPMPDGSAPGSAAGPSGPTLAAASPGSEILRIQEDGTLFQKGAAWVGIHSATGYDLTDAAGTICSGRPAGLAAAITPGQRIAMACSDGRNATLLVTATNAGGGSGQMIVGGARQSADILQGN